MSLRTVLAEAGDPGPAACFLLCCQGSLSFFHQRTWLAECRPDHVTSQVQWQGDKEGQGL